MPKKKQEKTKSQESKPVRPVIIETTQKQIPVKDITNGTIITNDNRLLKYIEVQPIPFQNLKVNSKNTVRRQFESFLKVAPSNFQIKIVSAQADLHKQIEAVQSHISKETNPECKRLGEEYKKSLEFAEAQNVERKFYIVVPNEGKAIRPNTKKEEIEKELTRLDTDTNRLKDSIRSCGNQAKVLNNNEVATMFYSLMNRNKFNETSFNDHYNAIYNRYYDAGNTNPYIPPTDYIAPDSINFNDKNFYMIDGRYYTHLYIAEDGYPKRTVCGWLDRYFISSIGEEGTDIDIFFRKKDKAKLKDSLRRTMSFSEFDVMQSGGRATDSFHNASTKLNNAELLYNYIQAGQDVYDVSVIITISGNNLQELGLRIDDLIKECKSSDIRLRDLPFQMEEGFKSTLPLNYISPKIENKAKRNMHTSAASTMYPFTSFQLIHDDGIYVADNIYGNTPVLPDFWDPDFVSNPHVFIVGSSGAGKTSFMLLLACHARVMDIPCYIIAPEKQDDYKRLTTALGGQFISIGPGSPNTINIMQVMENNATVLEENKKLYGDLAIDSTSYLSERLSVVIEFIHTSYKEMTGMERSYLNDALIETYRRKGITMDNDSLWADETHTRYKEMPILSDLVKVLEEMSQKNEKVEPLMVAVKFLTTGAGAHFNAQTNVDVNNKFFCIGLENNTKESKGLSAYVAEDFINNKVKEDKRKHKFFMIDELHALLSVIPDKIESNTKILRGFGVGLILGTQQIGDCLRTESGQNVIKNCDTRIIMKHKDEDVKYMSNYLDISSDEAKMIQSFEIGQGLLIANRNRLPIYARPTDFEKLLVFNDPETLKKWEHYVDVREAEKKKKEEEKELISKAKSIYDLPKDTTPDVKMALSGEEYLKQLSQNKQGE